MARKADTPSAFGIDRKFGSGSGFGTLGGPTSAARSAVKMPYTDRAKVAKAKGTAAAAVKAKAPKPVTTSPPPKPRPESALRKGGLAGLLGAFKANKGNNEELARQRMIKAARKG